MNTHTKWQEASGPGALAGWLYTCPTCGDQYKSSMKSSIMLHAITHENWHRTGAPIITEQRA